MPPLSAPAPSGIVRELAASNWQDITPSGLVTNSLFYGLAVSPAGALLVAGGELPTAKLLKYSVDDGRTWANVTNTFTAASFLRSACFGNGRWVVGGEGGEIESSAADGPPSVLTARVSPLTGAVVDLLWSEDFALFYALSELGEIASSPDSVTWTLRSNTLPVTQARMAAGPGKIITIGTGGAASSTDGVTFATDARIPNNAESIAYGAGMFITGGSPAGNGTALWFSVDGETWTRGNATVSSQMIGCEDIQYDGAGQWLSCFTYDGTGAALAQSSDGVNWDYVTPFARKRSVSSWTTETAGLSAQRIRTPPRQLEDGLNLIQNTKWYAAGNYSSAGAGVCSSLNTRSE